VYLSYLSLILMTKGISPQRPFARKYASMRRRPQRPTLGVVGAGFHPLLLFSLLKEKVDSRGRMEEEEEGEARPHASIPAHAGSETPIEVSLYTRPHVRRRQAFMRSFSSSNRFPMCKGPLLIGPLPLLSPVRQENKIACSLSLRKCLFFVSRISPLQPNIS